MDKKFYGSDLGKLQMHFHTTIRNVGLYLSVSLALLGASRYYRKGAERSRVKQLMFTAISLAFTTKAFLISKFLLNDHLAVLKNYEKKEVQQVYKWYIIPKMLLATSSLFICFSLYLSLNTIRKIIIDNVYE
tara:strand:+ start:182 stop:577 length:396 start_codon:yes stop_codon:yes gene_type:complete